MIRVCIEVSGDGRVRIESDGHAAAKDGIDSAPCAVVSTLVRAFGESAAEQTDCIVRGEARQPGQFRADVRPVNEAARTWLAGVVEVVRRQCLVVADAYPDQVEYKYVEEQIDGTQKGWWKFKKRS